MISVRTSLRRIASVLLLSAAFTAIATSQVSSADGEPQAAMPLAADSLADAIGVNTHFSYPGTAYIVRWPKVSAALLQSGFRHVRDGYASQDPAYVARIRYLGEHGISDTLGFRIGVTPDTIRATLHTFKPYVEAVEPSNEYDSAARKDPDWEEHIRADQRTLYATLRGDGDSKGITVLGPSFAHTALSAFADLSPYEDAGNLHAYLCRRHPGQDQFSATIALERSTAKPIWTTETGSGDNPLARCWLPDDVIAKYDPRIVAEALSAGQPRVFFYQFADTPGDVGFGAFGLITAAGDPKPQYTALVSLASLVSDPGPQYSLKPLRYSIASPSSDVDHLLLEKRSGVYDLLLWQEVRGYRDTPSGGVRVSVTPVTVSVSFAGARAVQYDTYDSTWALRGAKVDRGATNSIEVPVTDSISILEIR
jgi:serralysin